MIFNYLQDTAFLFPRECVLRSCYAEFRFAMDCEILLSRLILCQTGYIKLLKRVSHKLYLFRILLSCLSLGS